VTGRIPIGGGAYGFGTVFKINTTARSIRSYHIDQ
jgi:hypothetical protein